MSECDFCPRDTYIWHVPLRTVQASELRVTEPLVRNRGVVWAAGLYACERHVGRLWTKLAEGKRSMAALRRRLAAS